MQPGKLRHRVNIQVKPQAQDDWGEPIDQWIDVWTNVPAAIESLSGREFYAAQEINGEINAKITIRWRDGISPSHRILHRSREQAAMSPQEHTIYDIVAPVPDGHTMRGWLSLFVIRRFSKGFRSGVST